MESNEAELHQAGTRKAEGVNTNDVGNGARPAVDPLPASDVLSAIGAGNMANGAGSVANGARNAFDAESGAPDSAFDDASINSIASGEGRVKEKEKEEEEEKEKEEEEEDNK